jgi:molybdenum cofactor synthesis domain-containing protein
MQERCEHGENGVVINQLPRVEENIRRAGEDIAVGAEILKPGIKLRPQDIALAASAGLPELPVYRRVRVGVFFTGDELVQPGEPLPPGGIYNSNRYALRALLEGLGCEVRDLGTVPDKLDATREALRKAAADNDLIITSGGVSVGEEDHVKPAVEAEGQLDMWKIAIKPGKPLAFGEVRRSADHGGGKAWFIGLPGNPVSAIVTFMIMVRPFVLRLQGVTDVTPRAFNLRPISTGYGRMFAPNFSVRGLTIAAMSSFTRIRGPALSPPCVGAMVWSATNRVWRSIEATAFASCLLPSCCHERQNSLFRQPQGSPWHGWRIRRTAGWRNNRWRPA